jgi:hypothetical protein
VPHHIDYDDDYDNDPCSALDVRDLVLLVWSEASPGQKVLMLTS